MTSKQRSYLKSMASTMNPLFQIGKASLTPEVIIAIDDDELETNSANFILVVPSVLG